VSESIQGVEIDWDTAAQAFVKGFEAQLGIPLFSVEKCPDPNPKELKN